ncbi:MAG: outer membrane beta-barrel protein [Bacteroidales bacterium]|nr:outer membrane beta-barrel protein [Bacteroidales bacterium]
MKKIRTLLFIFTVCLPFWSTAQWSVNFFAGGGPAHETANQEKQVTYFRLKDSKTTYGNAGYTFQGGINVEYFINQKIGFGTGVGYQYSKTDGLPVGFSTPTGELPNWHSESIKIPFNFLWSPGKSHRSVLNVGLATHFNLMSYGTFGGLSNDQNPVFTSAQAGYTYRLGKGFQIGIVIETDLSWYARTTSYPSDQPPTTVFANRSFSSAQLILSYRLFGKN